MPSVSPGIHPSAVVADEAYVDGMAEVCAQAVIEAGADIGPGCKIGAGAIIGRHCAIAALVGISGFAEIDDCVVVGDQAGFAEHVHVGTRSRVGAQSGVISDLDPGAVVVGSPTRPAREMFREIARLKKLARAGRGDRPSGGEGARCSEPELSRRPD